jgi:hypothetical protein
VQRRGAGAAMTAPPAPEDEIPTERQFLGVPVRCAARKNRANLTAELLAVARSLIKRRPPCPIEDASALPPRPPSLKSLITPPPSPPPKPEADACTRSRIEAAARRLALEARCFSSDDVSAQIATYLCENGFHGDRAWATCVGDVWYTQNFLYDVVARLAPSINSPRYAGAFCRMPLPTSDAWSYFEVELTYDGDFVECFVGAQSAKETRRGVVCGKSRGSFGVATLGGLYSEGAFRRGGLEGRACDRVGVLSRVMGEHRHVIFTARRRGGFTRRAVGACQVSCSRDVFPTVTLRSRGVAVRALLDADVLPRRRDLPETGAVYSISGERLAD